MSGTKQIYGFITEKDGFNVLLSEGKAPGAYDLTFESRSAIIRETYILTKADILSLSDALENLINEAM